MLTVVSNPGLGGSVSAEPGPGYNGLYYADARVTLGAYPSAGYMFVDWSGAVAGVTDVTQATVSVVMDQDRTITANFVPAGTLFRLTASASNGGTVTLDPAGHPDYMVNETVSVSAIPHQGYAFSHWEGDLTGTSLTASIRMNSDKAIAAIFNATLTVERSVVNGGEIEAVPALTSNGYPVGTVVNLTARPSLGYLFHGWAGDVSDIPDTSDATVTVIMATGRTLTAEFVSSPPLKVEAVVQDEGSGSIVFDPVQPSEGYPASRTVMAYALPRPGYAFSHWTGDVGGTDPAQALTMDGEKRIVAVFDPKVMVQCDPVEGGTVEVTSPGSSGGYVSGTEIAVQAMASKGYRFKWWSGDASGSDNPTSIAVDSPKTLTAVFVKESKFPWWWVVLAIVVLSGGLVALRLVYVLLGHRLEVTEGS